MKILNNHWFPPGCSWVLLLYCYNNNTRNIRIVRLWLQMKHQSRVSHTATGSCQALSSSPNSKRLRQQFVMVAQWSCFTVFMDPIFPLWRSSIFLLTIFARSWVYLKTISSSILVNDSIPLNIIQSHFTDSTTCVEEFDKVRIIPFPLRKLTAYML